VLSIHSIKAQNTKKLLVIYTKEAYLKSVKEDSNKALVLLKKYVPTSNWTLNMLLHKIFFIKNSTLKP
jgi:hypothetical protein